MVQTSWTHGSQIHTGYKIMIGTKKIPYKQNCHYNEFFVYVNEGKFGVILNNLPFDYDNEAYRALHILPQIFAANHATLPIQMYAITGWIAVVSEAPSTNKDSLLAEK